jgi:hypothetical protein
MTIVCPRCASPNSRWEKRCYACWLLIDAALRTGAQAPTERARSGADERSRRPADPAVAPLTDVLGIEAEHVRALAAADIRTLEDIAQSLPETLEAALRVCAFVDPDALIARAHLALNGDRTAAKQEPEPPQPVEDEPNPDEWWKIR